MLGAAAGGYLLASIALAVTLSTSATVGEGHVSCGDPVLDGLTAEPLDPVTAAELKVEGLADSSDECRSAARARYSWAVGGYVALAAAGTTLLARRRTVAAR